MQETSNKTVSVIIVSRGLKDYLRRCLDSLMIQSFTPLEIIIIDNSLDHDFGQRLARDYPQVRLYSSPENLFYCQALNRGIRMSKGDLVLCLNDDIYLDKGFIKEASRGFEADPMVGMVSGKIMRTDARTIDSTGLFLTCWRTARERGYGVADAGQYEKEEYIFGVNGAAAFYRREMLEDIKMSGDYFDSDYRIFYEDLDIAWRANRCGWKAYYISRAVAYHVRGATVRGERGINKPYARRYLSPELHLDLLKNRYLTLIKNESFLGFLLHLPFILSYEVLSWGYILFCRPLLIKRFISNIRYIISAFRKRGLIKR